AVLTACRGIIHETSKYRQTITVKENLGGEGNDARSGANLRIEDEEHVQPGRSSKLATAVAVPPTTPNKFPALDSGGYPDRFEISSRQPADNERGTTGYPQRG